MSRFPAARFLLSVAAPGQFPDDNGAEVAFAGRSNAGKSSAINSITERNALARTSKTPGRTRLLNYFELAAGQRMVDLPGYGFAAVSAAERSNWVPLLDALRERTALRGLILIVDSRRGVRDEDLALIDWADPESRSVHVLLAKSDKLKQREKAQLLAQSKVVLAGRASVQLFSAHARFGVDEAQRRLVELLQ